MRAVWRAHCVVLFVFFVVLFGHVHCVHDFFGLCCHTSRGVNACVRPNPINQSVRLRECSTASEGVGVLAVLVVRRIWPQPHLRVGAVDIVRYACERVSVQCQNQTGQ